MNQRAVRNLQTILFALVTVTFLSYGCGGAASSDSQDSDNTPTSDNTDPIDQADTPADNSQASTPSETPTTQPDTQPNTQPDEDKTTAAVDSTDFLKRSDTRAMWVWDESPSAEQILDNAAGAQDALLSFSEAPHGDATRSINRLYFAARSYSNEGRFDALRQVNYDPLTDADKRAKLHAFIERANAAGVAVEYLDGQAIWVASDANAKAPKQICRDVVAFNKSTDNPAARFAGVHLDIEPHTVRSGTYAGQWWENRLPGGYNADWTARWKDILTSCRSTLDQYEAETGHHMTLASDLGTDYAHYNKPILEFLNRANGPLDYLAIMNYFDDRPNKDGQPSYFYGTAEGDEVTGGVVENLAAWDKLPLVFAFETGPTNIAPDEMSFFQEGYNAMYRTVDELLSKYNAKTMLGVAIHHYSPQSFRDMKP